MEVEGPEDIQGMAADTEIRVKQNAAFDICQRSCSKANFGWNLAQKLFGREDFIGRNFYGNRKNVLALSPRRRHAIEHSVCEVYGLSDGNIKEAVQGINAGLRKLRHRQPLSLVSLDMND